MDGKVKEGLKSLYRIGILGTIAQNKIENCWNNAGFLVINYEIVHITIEGNSDNTCLINFLTKRSTVLSIIGEWSVWNLTR